MKRRLILALMTGFALLALVTGCFVASGPRAVISVSKDSGYPPLVIEFSGTGSSSPEGIITDYHWDFGDGDTADTSSASHTYEDKGVYRVTLTVTDSTGAVDTEAINVEALNRAPVPSFTNPYMIATHEAATFNASASYDPDGTIVEYRWDFGDGTTGVGEIVQHVYTSAQGSGWKAPVMLTVTDDDGTSNSKTVRVQIIGCDSCG